MDDDWLWCPAGADGLAQLYEADWAGKFAGHVATLHYVQQQYSAVGGYLKSCGR